MKRLRRALVIVVLLAAVAAILPFFIPLDHYVPWVEQTASESLHTPVKIRSLRFSLIPTPRLVIKGVAIGRSHGLTIASVTAEPLLRSLFSPVKVLRKLTLRGVTVGDNVLFKLAGLGGKGRGGPSPINIARIALRQVNIQWGNRRLGPYRADIRLAPNGHLETARISEAHGKLSANVTPDGNAYRIQADAKNWRLPAGKPLFFERLALKSRLNAGELTIKQFQGVIYGGAFHGTGRLRWRHGWRFSGRLETSGVAVRPLIRVFRGSSPLGGQLRSRSAFTFAAKNADRLFADPVINSHFELIDGTLYNVDLLKAAKFLGKEGSAGQTRFDRLSGVLKMRGRRFHFSRLSIASGLLNATGNMAISPRRRLSGKIDVGLKVADVPLSYVPLRLSGSLDSPVVRPTNAALAGGVVGTAILGPGVGTSLGIAAGDKLKKWFDGGQK